MMFDSTSDADVGSLDYKLDTIRKKIISHCLLFEDDLGNPIDSVWLTDFRMLLVDPVVSKYAAEVIWDKLKLYDFTFLICSGVAGILWAKEIQREAYLHNVKLNLMIVRDKRKVNNRKRLIEGDRPEPKDCAFFVDDFIHTGGTYTKCMNALREEKIELNVIGLCALVDSHRPFTRSSRIRGKHVISVFKRPDLNLTRVDPVNNVITDINNYHMNIHIRNDPKGHEILSPPLLINNLLYVASNDHYLRCIDLTSKEIIWQDIAPTLKFMYVHKGIINMLPYDERYIYYTSYHGFVTKLNRFTGDIIWRILGDTYIHSSPILNTDSTRLYFSTEYYDEGKPYGDLVSVDTNNGNLIWRYRTNDLVPCTPCLDNNNLYVSSNDSYAYSVDAIDGNLIWKEIMTSPAKGKPKVINDYVIFVNEDGYIHVYEKHTGRLHMKKRCAPRFRHCVPEFISDDCFVVIDTFGMIKCFDTNLEMKWITQVRGSGNWYPIKESNNLYFLTTSGYLVNIDSATGKKISYTNFYTGAGSPIAINDQYIVVSTLNKGIFVYDRKN